MKKNFLLSIALLVSAFVSAQPAPGSFKQTWKVGPDWLRNGVIYQVYPSSYKDSDGNGIGDIQGVISKLDYIESLGVSAIWFNPLFVSGWIDGGYDVIDFYRVDPRFGTNNDLVELIRESPRQRNKGDARPCGRTHFRQASVVPPERAGQQPPVLRLLHLVRPSSGREGRERP